MSLCSCWSLALDVLVDPLLVWRRRKSTRAPTPKVPPGGFMLSCCCGCLPLRLDNPLAKSRSRNLVPRFRQSRYLALLIKTREQSVPRAENANRPALKGSPSNMAEMAVRRLETNAVRRNQRETSNWDWPGDMASFFEPGGLTACGVGWRKLW